MSNRTTTGDKIMWLTLSLMLIAVVYLSVQNGLFPETTGGELNYIDSTLDTP